MEALYDLPSGDRVRVIDTATVGQLYREGATERLLRRPARPEGVVISFDQWAEYEALKDEVEFERRTEQIARDRIANSRVEDSVSFEDMMSEYGLDPDSDKP